MNGRAADTAAALGYIAFVALLGLAGAGVAHGLASGGSSRRALTWLARAGGVALVLGVIVGTARWLADGSLDGDGPSGVLITLYFLLGGFLFSSLGWRDRQPTSARCSLRSTV